MLLGDRRGRAQSGHDLRQQFIRDGAAARFPRGRIAGAGHVAAPEGEEAHDAGAQLACHFAAPPDLLQVLDHRRVAGHLLDRHLVQLDRLERGRVHRDHLQSLAGDHPPELGDVGLGQLMHAELADLVELQVGEAHLTCRRKGDRGIGCDLVGNDAQ